MANLDIARRRLHNQHISRATYERPGDVVRWLGAVQAQDYLGALWAVGLRMRHATEQTIEHAIADRTIIRTWPMRGTLHFVAPEDARWMLKLLTPRVIARGASRYGGLGLDDEAFSRSRDVVESALQGGKRLTRNAMYEALEAAGISTAGSRGLHISGYLAQQGVICFGPREGKQPTFVLLEEWAPAARALEGEEALAELAERYFASHGPATVQDFAWWAGLPLTEARAGLEAVKAQLIHEVIDGQTYWSPSSPPASAPAEGPAEGSGAPIAHLLPAFDEYTVAYKDRSAVLEPEYVVPERYGILAPTIEVDGRVVGLWSRTLKKDSVAITPSYFTTLDEAASCAVESAARRYGEFLGATAAVQ
jgi:hypothetical protein